MKNKRECILNEPDLLIDKLPDGQLEVRKVILDEDGAPIYHRHVVIPGIVDAEEDPRVIVIAQQVQTRKVINKFWVEENKRQAYAER